MSPLGKMYGLASRTIHAQRSEIARLRLHFIAARQKCSCGAWLAVCNEIQDDDEVRKELERIKQQLRAARTFRTTEQENPRCECNHLWSDHDDGGACGFKSEHYDVKTGKSYRKPCQYADRTGPGICQHFRPWNPRYRR